MLPNIWLKILNNYNVRPLVPDLKPKRSANRRNLPLKMQTNKFPLSQRKAFNPLPSSLPRPKSQPQSKPHPNQKESGVPAVIQHKHPRIGWLPQLKFSQAKFQGGSFRIKPKTDGKKDRNLILPTQRRPAEK
jgi:hypothetical protein